MSEPQEPDHELEAHIVHLAHIADKNLLTGVCSAPWLYEHLGRSLEKLLREYRQNHPQDSERIIWAGTVLHELQTGACDVTAAPPPAAPADILAAIRERRSVRRWTEVPVAPETVSLLLEAARWAPSSGNRQAVRLVVLRREECRLAAAQLKEKWFAAAPIIILVGVDLRVYKPDEVRRGTLPCLDAGAAIENLLLAGHAVGLGCVWSKLDTEDWQDRPECYARFKKSLNLPAYFYPLSLIGVGWPAYVARTPPRHPPSEFVRFDDQGFPPADYPDWRPPPLHRLRRRLRSLLRLLGKNRPRR